MLRNFGFATGLLTLVLDMLKGVVPALVGFYLFGGPSAGQTAYIGLFVGGLSSLVGNIFPVFYGFRGGKGAAIVYGMYCVAQPILGVIIFIGGLLYFLIFEYASLFSFIMVTCFTIYEAYTLGIISGNGNIVISCLLFVIFCLVFYGHRQNIFRLLVGKENRVSLKGSIKKIKEKKLTKEQKQELKEKEIG